MSFSVCHQSSTNSSHFFPYIPSFCATAFHLYGVLCLPSHLLFQVHFLSTDQSNYQILAGAVTVATTAPHMPLFASHYCCIPLFPTQTARYCLGIMSLHRRGGFGLIPAAEQKILLLQLLGWRSKARANLLNSWMYSGKRWEGAIAAISRGPSEDDDLKSMCRKFSAAGWFNQKHNSQ